MNFHSYWFLYFMCSLYQVLDHLVIQKLNAQGRLEKKEAKKGTGFDKVCKAFNIFYVFVSNLVGIIFHSRNLTTNRYKLADCLIIARWYLTFLLCSDSNCVLTDCTRLSYSNCYCLVQNELAAILRFGAEELFKDDKNEEDQKSKLENMDIDEILARAEKVETKTAEVDAEGNELLGAFKVLIIDSRSSIVNT